MVPSVDDLQLITANSRNTRLHQTSYPHLKNELATILNGYDDYHANRGNAFNVSPVNVSESLCIGLKKNYKSPPKDLKFIQNVRKSSPNVCPMCGSLKTGTVDHLFPQDDYPWFSVYSKNLVPACDCNSKRKTNLTDGNKRILHPYYDQVLNQRLLSCEVTPIQNFPKAEFTIKYVLPEHPEIDSIKYHVEKVVLPSGLISWAEGEWETTAQIPSSKIHTLPLEKVETIEIFESCLQGALDRYDRAYATPNNWFSIYFHGLLTSEGVTQFLFDLHNDMYE